MATGTLVLPSFDGTMGCLFLSAVFTSVLWGVGTVQVYLYYEAYIKSDKKWLKLYVLIGYALDTFHQCVMLQAVYVYLVKDIGNLLDLTVPHRSLLDTPIIAGIIDYQVQLLFVFRAWLLSEKNMMLAAFLLVLISGKFATVIVYFVQLYHDTNASQLVKSLPTAKAMGAVFFFVDTTLACTLAFLLHRKRSGFDRTDALLTRIMIYTISTGLISGVWALVGLFTSIFLPNDFVYLLVYLVMPKIYFNCMLNSLNLRGSRRSESLGTNEMHIISASSRPSNATPKKIDFAPNLSEPNLNLKVNSNGMYYNDPSTVVLHHVDLKDHATSRSSFTQRDSGDEIKPGQSSASLNSREFRAI